MANLHIYLFLLLLVWWLLRLLFKLSFLPESIVMLLLLHFLRLDVLAVGVTLVDGLFAAGVCSHVEVAVGVEAARVGAVVPRARSSTPRGRCLVFFKRLQS